MAAEPPRAADAPPPAVDAEIYGTDVSTLSNELVGLLAGVVLDAADALEISLRQLGVPATRATASVNSVVDIFRARFALHGACLRSYTRHLLALPPSVSPSHVFAQTPSSTASERDFRKQIGGLDSQLATAEARLAKAVAARQAADADQRALQKHVAMVEDVAAAGADWPGPGDAEELRMIRMKATEKDRAFAQVQYRLEDDESDGVGEETPDEGPLAQIGPNLGNISSKAHEDLTETAAKPLLANHDVEELKDYENFSALL